MFMEIAETDVKLNVMMIRVEDSYLPERGSEL